MMSSRSGRQNCNRSRRRIADLRERRTGVAQLGSEGGFFVANLGAAVSMDMTKLVQQGPLLRKNQQQRQNECQMKSGGFHGPTEECPVRLSHHPRSSLLNIPVHFNCTCVVQFGHGYEDR